MLELIRAARDGFVDSLILAIAIPLTIFSGFGALVRNFLGVSKRSA